MTAAPRHAGASRLKPGQGAVQKESQRKRVCRAEPGHEGGGHGTITRNNQAGPAIAP